MRINHNIAAFNTYSRLTGATVAQGKSLEKLSSGLRINKAGDDAAGLAISEKMRGQIRGLEQASRNSQDGISMIQTAEGALNETHSILQRMRELAVQAGNDTNTTADRNEIQKEVNQLTSEINRIGNNTEFNTQKLLNGSLSTSGGGSTTALQGTTFQAAADAVNAVYTFTMTTNAAAGDTFAFAGSTIAFCATAGAGGSACVATIGSTGSCIATSVTNLVGALNQDSTFNTKWIAVSNGDGSFKITAKAGTSLCGTSGNGCTATVTGTAVFCAVQNVCGTDSTQQVNQITLGACAMVHGTKIKIGDKTFALWDSACDLSYTTDAEAKVALCADVVLNINHTCYNTAAEVVCVIAACTSVTGVTLAGCTACATMFNVTANTYGSAGAEEATYSLTVGASSSSSGSGITLQIGANASQTFTTYFEDMRGCAINITRSTASCTYATCDSKTAHFTGTACVTNGTSSEYALDVSTSAAYATAAVSALDDAIKTVSAERSKLGAYTNRLEHTIQNLNASSENLTAAESRVRDVDMAREMMDFTKNNILNQAATAMLAQANQQPQGVLQLLR